MKLAGPATSGTAPRVPYRPPCAAPASGGLSVPPPETPQGATATMAKSPFFLVANAFEEDVSIV